MFYPSWSWWVLPGDGSPPHRATERADPLPHDCDLPMTSKTDAWECPDCGQAFEMREDDYSDLLTSADPDP